MVAENRVQLCRQGLTKEQNLNIYLVKLTEVINSYLTSFTQAFIVCCWISLF